MTPPDASARLVSAYSTFLVVVAYTFDLLARRVAKRSQDWRNGSFTYHPDHDAWACPEDQWLWPTTFDRSSAPCATGQSRRSATAAR